MYLQKINLKNKYALVTGAGKGLGRACSIALAEAGATIIALSRTSKDLDKLEKEIKKMKFKKLNIGNLETNISNKKIGQSVNGNTNTVYINPLNSLRFVLNKIKKDKINLDKDFYVFTGSTVGVVPIMGKGLYTGKIEKLGSVKAIIN